MFISVDEENVKQSSFVRKLVNVTSNNADTNIFLNRVYACVDKQHFFHIGFVELYAIKFVFCILSNMYTVYYTCVGCRYNNYITFINFFLILELIYMILLPLLCFSFVLVQCF